MDNWITIFGLTFNINPIAFEVFGWDIYWYGILITLGVVLALFYGLKNGDRLGIKPDHIIDSFLVILPISVLAARTYYIIFDPYVTFKDFFDFSGSGFRGLAIYGGVIGAAISILVMQRIYKFNLLAALDVTSIGFLIGQGIGRWGNFVNQEAYGIQTGSDWFGMTGNVISKYNGDQLVHPCFLYESIWCIIGFFLLHHFSKKRKYKGQIALMYGAWYGFERTFIELLRTDSLMLGGTGIRVSSLLSAVLCITCIILLIVLGNRRREKEKAENYDSVFGDTLAEVKGESLVETTKVDVEDAESKDTETSEQQIIEEKTENGTGEDNNADN